MLIRIQFADGLTKIHDLQAHADGRGGQYYPMGISVYHPGRRTIVNVFCDAAKFRFLVASHKTPIYREQSQDKKVG